jgi:hypothetical protein
LEPSGSYGLTLIGTVHGDPRGRARAGELLDRLGPELVTVEISPFSLRYRGRHEARWQRQLADALAELPEGAALHLAIRRLAAQVALPFEVRAAQDYSRRAVVPWRPLDLGFLSRRHLPRYGPELLNPANLKALLTTVDGELEEFVAGEFRRAREALARAPGVPSLPAPPRPPDGNASWRAGSGASPFGIAGWCTWAAGSIWWPGRTPRACGVSWRTSSRGGCSWTRRMVCRASQVQRIRGLSLVRRVQVQGWG